MIKIWHSILPGSRFASKDIESEMSAYALQYSDVLWSSCIDAWILSNDLS